MNSISILHAGSTSYYTKELSKVDYYTTKDSCGYFTGEGLEQLKLKDTTIKEQDERLKDLFEGKHPETKEVLRKGANSVRNYKKWLVTDEQGNSKQYKKLEDVPQHLRANAKEEVKQSKSVIGYDNVFSAPKAVSILWSQSEPKLRDQIHSIHKEAVKEATKHLEQYCYLRLGTKGVDRSKAKPIIAVFDHNTSRSLDPQIHTHVVLINTAFNKEGKSGALDGQKILNERYVSGMIYQNTLRHELEKQLGVKTFDKPFSNGKGMSFGIEGLGVEVNQHFSKRSLEIEKKINSKMTGSQKRVEVLKTRPEKDDSVTEKELFNRWKREGMDLGINPYMVINQQPTVKTESIKEQEIKVDRKKETKGLERTSNYQAPKEEKQPLEQQPPKPARINLKPVKEVEQKKAIAFKKEEKKHPKTINPEKLNSAISTEIYFQGKEQPLTSNDIKTIVLGKVRGIVSSKEALKISDSYQRQYTYNQNIRGRSYYRLNYDGRKQINYKFRYNRNQSLIKNAIEWHKVERLKAKQRNYQAFRRKMTYLYWTGKITRRQYLQFTEGKYLPQGKFMIVTHQALGLISAKQAKTLMAKEDRIKKFEKVLEREKEVNNKYTAFSQNRKLQEFQR